MPDNLLTREQRQYLEKLVKETADESLSRRARVLLLYDDQLATRHVAEGAGLSRGRTRYWRRQFQGRGMAIFSRDQKFPDLRPTEPKDGEEQAGKPAQGKATRPKKTKDGGGAPTDTRSVLDEFAAATKALGSPGVLSDDPLAEAGRKVWRYHFAMMLLHEEGTLLGEDIEELHDMRVATRRMRAAFDVFGSAFAPKAIKRHLRGLRATGRALGQVRDLDVFIDKAQRYQVSLSPEHQRDLEPLLEAWARDRADARREMIAYLASSQYQDFKEKFYKFLSTPGAGVLPRSDNLAIPYLVREAAPVLIYNRLAAVRTFDTILDQAALEQFHALRIEFKKLRYTLEYFREVLGSEAKTVISEIKSMQDHLGDLNDADVAAGILRDFLTRWDALQAERPVAERRGPEPILTYLASRYAERQRLILSFKEAWLNFNRPQLRQELAKAVAVL